MQYCIAIPEVYLCQTLGGYMKSPNCYSQNSVKKAVLYTLPVLLLQILCIWVALKFWKNGYWYYQYPTLRAPMQRVTEIQKCCGDETIERFD